MGCVLAHGFFVIWNEKNLGRLPRPFFNELYFLNTEELPLNKEQFGWKSIFEESFLPYKEQGLEVGRVTLEHKRMYRILTENGELLGEVTGKLRYEAGCRSDYPAVGDWVVISPRWNEEKASIHAILPRFSKFSRKEAGLVTEEQIVATNVDTVFLVNALNRDLNVRRIERYLIMAWESGSNPVIILSKADLCEDIEAKIQEVVSVAFGIPVHVISVVDGRGMNELSSYVIDGKTVALLGSSGAGKSTLTNYLVGEDKQLVQEIREGDDRGRHTTTNRELIVLPTGGILIDTPGMRELQLWEADVSLGQSFQDIEELALHCQFRDCSHQKEPNCAVREAIRDCLLDQKRFDNFIKLQKELAYLDRKADKKAQLAEKEKWKKIAGDRTRVNRR